MHFLLQSACVKNAYSSVALRYHLYQKERIFMAGDCSFDIVSQFDEQELVNAIDQTRREVSTRFDLKDTKTEIVHTKDTITIVTDSSLTLKSVRDILETKAVRRGLSLKIFGVNNFCFCRSEEHTSELQSLTNLVCR